jgi:hypothetical protein
MGLTGGLVDVGDLFDCLRGIHDDQATSDILDKYDHYRREKYRQFTDPVSESNLKRMRLDLNEAEVNDPGLKMMREADESLESSKTFQLVGYSQKILFIQNLTSNLLGGPRVGT